MKQPSAKKQKVATANNLKALGEKIDKKIKPLQDAINILKTDVAQLKIDVSILKKAVENQALKLLEHDQRFEEIKEEMRQHKSEILNAIDGAVKQFQDTVNKVAIDRMLFERHSEVLDSHEKRLQRLETTADAR